MADDDDSELSLLLLVIGLTLHYYGLVLLMLQSRMMEDHAQDTDLLMCMFLVWIRTNPGFRRQFSTLHVYNTGFYQARLTPHASRLTYHASRLTPHALRVLPHASIFQHPPMDPHSDPALWWCGR